MIDRHRTILGSAAILLAATATADTITVCPDGSCDFTDPAAAAAVATSGDVIEIAAGTYLLDEQVIMYGPGFEIRGAVDRKGRPATILDGQGATQILGILLGTGESARVENVVITNGFAEYGGGIFIRHSLVNFENCVINGNHAEFQGGGMFLIGGDFWPVTFEGCEISGNTVSHPEWDNSGHGAAGWISTGTVRLVDSEVSGNSAHVAGGAFGIIDGGVVLDNSRICGNDAGQASEQNYVGNDGAVTIITGCIEDSCDCLPVSPADLNQNGVVNGADLGFMLAAWGSCADCAADLNGDGEVNGADLGLLLAAWG